MTAPDVRGRAVAMYQAGASGPEIAAALNVHPRTVQRWARQADALRGRGPRGRTDVPTALIVELRDVEGLSWRALAAEVGMSRTGCRLRYLVASTGSRPR